jgi:hypothetical protein
MTITAIPSAAALRPRTLSTQVWPSAVPAAGVDSWRKCAPTVGVPTFMRTKSAFQTIGLNHNSILSTVVVTLAQRGRNDYGAAKQASPPRGVPR